MRGQPGESGALGRDPGAVPTFKELADTIDDAFARWDRTHLQEFTFADQRRLCLPDPDWEIDGTVSEDHRRVRLSRLHLGEQFMYVFDLDDNWATCARPGRSGSTQSRPSESCRASRFPTSAGGDIPDQYRRRWDGDDGESPQPRDPGLTGLPPLRPDWGPARAQPG